ARPEARDRADRGGRRDGGGRPDPAAARRDGPGRPDPGGAPRDGGRPAGDSRRDVSSRRDGGGRRDAAGRDPGGRRDGRDPAARRDASGRPDPSPRRDASGRPDPSPRRDASGRPDPAARRDASGRPDPAARRDRPPRPDAGTRPPRAIAPPPDDDAETTWPRAASFASDDDPTSSGERRASSDEAWGDDADAPTADVVLAADLPADPPADDPDPSTAFLDDPDRDEPGDDRRGQGGIRSVVGVKFTTAGKIYLFDAGDDSFAAGEDVVVDSERGPRVGRVAVAPLRQDVGRSGPLRRVLRRPTRGDERRLDANRERAEAALRAAKSTARELGLPIKVFHAELSLGGSKALIYYSSDDKVDARRLLRDLSQKLHLRIELRQTGVRDEAKMVGGIGSCGQELCCTTWLPAFVPVSIKNAKDQGLVLNPTKVSGQCGRLKCCLVYEQATYAELRRGLPKLGKRVVTASGEGRVVEVDVLRQRVRVSLMGGVVEIFAAGEVQPLFPSQAGGRPDDQPG
ncbi:MAG TPA: regulatory iron-sulfur-containing complex subunit RicT, partial [Kofleriaceae bacterium]|nr:regulatory iron-sulfur-containing complex subunit RicT [Kofleriaceae bacterium]